MNIEEINDFMKYWSKDFTRQRIGYLYGYYAKDSNYPVYVYTRYYRMEYGL